MNAQRTDHIYIHLKILFLCCHFSVLTFESNTYSNQALCIAYRQQLCTTGVCLVMAHRKSPPKRRDRLADALDKVDISNRYTEFLHYTVNLCFTIRIANKAVHCSKRVKGGAINFCTYLYTFSASAIWV